MNVVQLTTSLRLIDELTFNVIKNDMPLFKTQL